MTPPFVLNERVVTITRPQPPPISVTLPLDCTLSAPWPPRQVARAEPPRPLPERDVIRLATPPQGPWRWRLPPVVRYLLSDPDAIQ